jgi:hypothetical protein
MDRPHDELAAESNLVVSEHLRQIGSELYLVVKVE